jgi:hypothetical protein
MPGQAAVQVGQPDMPSSRPGQVAGQARLGAAAAQAGSDDWEGLVQATRSLEALSDTSVGKKVQILHCMLKRMP